MQKKQTTTTSTLSKLAEYEAPQVVCHSIANEGVLAASRPPIGFEDDRGTPPGGGSGWGSVHTPKPTETEDWNN